MSQLNVDTIEARTNNSITLGGTSDTITIPAGATITNSGTANGFGGGKVLQVVTAYGSSGGVFGSSYATVSDTNITITPSATSSRIHLTWNTGAHTEAKSGINAIAVKGVSSKDGTIFEMFRYAYCNLSTSIVPCPLFVTYVDSPNSTSAITYSLQLKCGTSAGFFVNPDGGTNQVRVIAMEIEA